MRLFDQLKLSGFRPFIPMPADLLKNAYDLSRRWVAELDKANPAIVLIDNVANYYWEGTPETWAITDFPSLAPPWPLTFLEYRAPSKIIDREGSTPFDREALGQHFGILLDSVEAGTDITFRPQLPGTLARILPGHREDLVPPAGEGIKWMQEASVFSELHGDIALVGTFAWGLNDDGVFHEAWKDLGGLPFLAPFSPNMSFEEKMPLAHSCWCYLAPALLAISFIHCRNTVIRDVEPESPRLRKANLKRGKPPYVRYKTLEIEPIKKVLSVQGNAAATGLKHALHICRGHFKDYREHGLFGKYKDLYWWDMHVRGHLKEGLVIKDYAIGPIVEKEGCQK
jgi:hypothetical protein